MSQAYQIATPKYFGMLLCNALSVIGLCCLVYRAPTIQLFVVTISLSVIMMIMSLWQICFYMRKRSSDSVNGALNRARGSLMILYCSTFSLK